MSKLNVSMEPGRHCTTGTLSRSVAAAPNGIFRPFSVSPPATCPSASTVIAATTVAITADITTTDSASPTTATAVITTITDSADAPTRRKRRPYDPSKFNPILLAAMSDVVPVGLLLPNTPGQHGQWFRAAVVSAISTPGSFSPFLSSVVSAVVGGQSVDSAVAIVAIAALEQRGLNYDMLGGYELNALSAAGHYDPLFQLSLKFGYVFKRV